MNKRFLITFEGPEGGGKTTQAKKLAELLEMRGYEVVLLREPGGTEAGERIGEILRDSYLSGKIDDLTELLLFLSARRQLSKEKILPSLKKGKVIILDRFKDSTVAYQGWGRGIDISFIHHLNDVVTEYTNPDLTILLDLEVGEGLKRRRGRLERIDQEEIQFHRRVRDGYLFMSEHDPLGRWLKIDASKAPDELAAEILEITLWRLWEAGIESRKEISFESHPHGLERI